MKLSPQDSKSLDFLNNKLYAWLSWGLPVVVMLLSRLLGSQFQVTAWVWGVMFFWMGLSCLLNAWRCHRVHCYFAVPLFFVSTMGALGIALDWAVFDTLSLDYLGLFTLVIFLLVWVVSEKYWGCYKGD
ncbi:MAG: hypothetical protein QF470_08070 [Methylococcales bacterium]|jgi:hypothetical protein|nr:hypothetical protein [Methylococcales bacterium]